MFFLSRLHQMRILVAIGLFLAVKNKTALGLHPELAHLRHEELAIFDILLPQVKYVGEIGLDGGQDYKNMLRSN